MSELGLLLIVVFSCCERSARVEHARCMLVGGVLGAVVLPARRASSLKTRARWEADPSPRPRGSNGRRDSVRQAFLPVATQGTRRVGAPRAFERRTVRRRRMLMDA